MIVVADGHWHGDPAAFCGRLEISAEAQREAEYLAAIFRLLRTDRGDVPFDRLERLASAAETIVAEDLAAVAPAPC